MYTYKLTIAYEGTGYVGWQVQLTGPSIQEVLQDRLSIIQNKKVDVTGAGRTDAGVHAYGQTAHFVSDAELELWRFQHALNSLLPKDIRIIAVEQVENNFHSRYTATGKIYRYQLSLTPTQSPFVRHYAWHLPYKEFSIELMKQAAEKLLGTHDFKGFATRSSEGVAAHDSIRTIKRIDFIEGEVFMIEFEGDGFLYKMVRNMVGTFVDIGRGQLPLSVIDQVLIHKDRALAGQTAPAHGLFLKSVLY